MDKEDLREIIHTICSVGLSLWVAIFVLFKLYFEKDVSWWWILLGLLMYL